jgi:diguanylate cyclase (GGDEF)-like protein
MFWRFVLVVTEILTITFWNYKMSGSYYSLDVLYCLPIIQAARLGAIRSLRHSDTQMSALVGVVSAVVWSIAEAAVVWPNYPLGAFTMNIFTRSVTFTVLGRVLTKLWKERDFFRKDVLTGLANRMEFTERFAAEQLRSEWSNRPYSLLFVEIDQFKMLKDNPDHRVGVAALKVLSGILKDNSRCIDTVARIGEGKFGLLFPETDEYICGILGMRIKSASDKKFQAEGWPISLSVGHVTVSGSAKSFEEIVREADEKMYSIKMQSHTQWDRYNSKTLTQC